jgi:hypothetical protein
MTLSILPDAAFDRHLSLSEKAERAHAIASDEAFCAAMTREIGRGRVKVTAGTFKDHTPALGARRVTGEATQSACGSPAQMCLEATGQAGGAGAMK